MTEAFPLLSAALDQPFEARTPAEDVGHMLDALGLPASSYHSFDPPAPMPVSPSPQTDASPNPVRICKETPQPAEDEAALPFETIPAQTNLPHMEAHGLRYMENPIPNTRGDPPQQTWTGKNVAFETPQFGLESSISLREMFQIIGASPGASRRRLRQVFSPRGRSL